MNILAAIKREEKKLEEQLDKLNHQLSGVRAAAKALGHSAEREVVGVKKRVLSAASLKTPPSADWSLPLPLRSLQAVKLLSQALNWLTFVDVVPSSLDLMVRFVAVVNEQTKQGNIADEV
jgi:hypothetical protein